MNRALLVAATALLASPALAHVDPFTQNSFAAGLAHPTGGADHLLAMVAVGIYAWVLGGSARLALPGGFLGGMTLGFLVALVGLPLSFVEPVILASIIVLGLMLAFAIRPATVSATAIVALFGLFHGHAHGSELGQATVLMFGAGFVLGTSALHATGVGLGIVLTRSRLLRMALGTGTAAAGLALTFT